MKKKKKDQPISSKKNRTVKNNMHGHAADKKQDEPMQTWTRNKQSQSNSMQRTEEKEKM